MGNVREIQVSAGCLIASRVAVVECGRALSWSKKKKTPLDVRHLRLLRIAGFIFYIDISNVLVSSDQKSGSQFAAVLQRCNSNAVAPNFMKICERTRC
jgi:hypothetical protein